MTDRPAVAVLRAEWDLIRHQMADTPARAFTDRLMAALEAGPCRVCGGRGWYATGETDAPQQVQCEACGGRGEAGSPP